MKYEVYAPLEVAKDFSKFDFISYGKNGVIHKRIVFSSTEDPDIYNLAFGDVDAQGEIDDYAISNNGDRNKILATVALVVELYLIKYPQRSIYFEGSTPERTRLHRIAIGLNFEELSQKFDISAKKDHNATYVPFDKNMAIIALLIKNKQTGPK